MTDEQRSLLLARLTFLPDDDPLLVGLTQIAVDLLGDANEESHRLGLTSDDRAFLDGRASALADWRAQVRALFEESKKPPA